MSPHFDTDQAKEDPRLSSCDLYVFEGRPGTTVMAMTSNADAGISSPDALHPEGLYAIRFDTEGDARQDVVFEFRFGEPRHAHGEESRHAYDVMLSLATNTVVHDGVAPNAAHTRRDFPYYGPPFSAKEQVGLLAI